MKRILVAVDQTKASLEAVKKIADVFGGRRSKSLTLIHVQRMAGMSVLDDTLPQGAELEEIKKGMEGSDRQQVLDEKANRIMAFYTKFFEDHNISGVDVLIKEGHPADEILAAAKELQCDLICIGSRAARFHNIFLGSVSREVANNAEISVLIIR